MVKLLPEPKDLFKNGILSSFIVKIGDFGQVFASCICMCVCY